MRLALVAALVGTAALALPLPAFAVQTGKIYKSADGEWMCIDRWGNEIPPSSTGGWTVVSPPRKVGGECNNQFVVATGGPVAEQMPAIDVLVTGTTKGQQSKGINEAGIR